MAMSSAVIKVEAGETKKEEKRAPDDRPQRPRRPSFNMNDHSQCCDLLPPLLSASDVKWPAIWKHDKLRPNVFGLYASACGHKGSRRSMEDRHKVVYGKGSRGFFGVFDGHGGQESADFAMLHLHKYIRYGGEPESAVPSSAGGGASAHAEKMHALSELTHAHIPPQPLGPSALSAGSTGKAEPDTTSTVVSAGSAVIAGGSAGLAGKAVVLGDEKEDKRAGLGSGSGSGVVAQAAGTGLSLHASAAQQQAQATGAPATTVKGFRPRIGPGEPFKREIDRAFLRAEEDVLNMSRRHGFRDGCTVSAVWVFGDTLYCGNLGDSRVVMCRGGQAVALTRDHKPHDPEEKQRIIAAGGEVRPVMKERPAFCCFKAKKVPQGADRLWPGGFSVSRALGDIDYKDLKRGKVKVVGTLSAKPDVTVFSISKDDTFFICATDGFWDVMTNQEACDYVLKESRKKDFDPDRLAEKMVTRCFQLGSEDNISCVVVFFTHHGDWRTDQC